MDIRSLFAPRRHTARSGGFSSLPREHTQGFKDNAALNAQIQRDIDRETIYIDGPDSPQMREYLNKPVIWHVVTREELDKLNGR